MVTSALDDASARMRIGEPAVSDIQAYPEEDILVFGREPGHHG